MKFGKKIEELVQKIENASPEQKSQAIMDSVQELVAQENASLIAEYQTAANEVQANKENAKQYGLRTLTKEEKGFYSLIQSPKQLAGAYDSETDNEKLIPTTITNHVFESLKKDFPLFKHVNWSPAGLKKWILGNKSGKAVWGDLDAKIVSQIKASLEEINLDVNKLSAFAFIPKALFDLGHEWVDKFLRESLILSIEEGLEEGIIKGRGKSEKEPVGLKKSLVGVVDGVYKDRTPIAVNSFSVADLAPAATVLTKGGTEKLSKLVMIVNPLDSITKVAAASTILTTNGDHKKVFPYDIEVIESEFVSENEAILYLSKTYTAGINRMGIAKSEHAQFLEDNIVYKAVAYGNGRLQYDHQAVVLDITNLQPLALNVNVINVADLAPGV